MQLCTTPPPPPPSLPVPPAPCPPAFHSEAADNKTCLANSNNFPWVLCLTNRARAVGAEGGWGGLISSPVSLCGALIYLIYMINIPNAVLIILPISAYFTQPLVPGDFDWYRRMKCQHVTDKNQFPDFTLPLLPTKLGQNSPDKKECVFRCAGGEAIHQNAVILPARQKANTAVTFSHARHFISPRNLSIISIHSLHLCVQG